MGLTYQGGPTRGPTRVCPLPTSCTGRALPGSADCCDGSTFRRGGCSWIWAVLTGSSSGSSDETGDLPRSWCAAGYEIDRRLLRAARRRHLANASFRRIDLNDAAARVVQPGDLVICLETLEHVGNYRHALRVLHNSVKPGGWIVLSMPNEVGLVGLVKFLARPLLRRHAYGDFFTGAKEVVGYTVTLATGGDLERFRAPPRTGWGPHLGFDHRQVVHNIRRTFVDTGLWQVEEQQRSALGANLFLVVRRVDDSSTKIPVEIPTREGTRENGRPP